MLWNSYPVECEAFSFLNQLNSHQADDLKVISLTVREPIGSTV